MATFSKSVGFALNGIKQCFKRELHFKVHTVFTILAIAAGFLFSINKTEWIIISICIAAVLTAELINTAIEELCNIVYKEDHPGIKLVKDLAAGAVLIMAIAAAISGAVIFIPKIILFINQ
ncbi:MAG: diacylglycerol kinase family protein [Ferruginibacter sp.]